MTALGAAILAFVNSDPRPCGCCGRVDCQCDWQEDRPVMTETILMTVTQELVDAILDVLNDSDAYRRENGDKPIGATVKEWASRADTELENAHSRQFFVEKKVNYTEDGDVLWA